MHPLNQTSKFTAVTLLIVALGGCSGSAASTTTPTTSAASSGDTAASTTPSASASTSAVSVHGVPATTVTAGSNYSFQPTVEHGAAGAALTFSIHDKPSWAIFSNTTGLLSGTPKATDVGTFANIAIAVSDGKSSASLAGFSIRVQAATTTPPVGPPPPVTPPPPITPPPVTAGGNAGVVQGATPIKVCTTAMVGSHLTYDVGPGKAYAELDTVPFGALVAGDVVNIYARPAAYKAKIGLRAQGTAADPVVINGVSDSACNKPVLDFSGATTASGSNAGTGHNVFAPAT
ncbi:MAG: sheath polysaccharide-degrading, partial [Gammaproteobacteria bacterium]|nr:sheath polysaccharide-degrading [Gammaproteobacteria bacterium]